MLIIIPTHALTDFVLPEVDSTLRGQEKFSFRSDVIEPVPVIYIVDNSVDAVLIDGVYILLDQFDLFFKAGIRCI